MTTDIDKLTHDESRGMVFSGTAVPVQTLLDYLEAGDSIEDFLDAHPQVTREHVTQLFARMKQELAAAA